MLENLANYADRDRYSGYVNSIVHELHTRHPEMESFTPEEFRQNIESVSQRTAYLEMAAKLNGLPGSNKAYIGRKLHDTLASVRGTGQISCFAHRRLYEECVFIFCAFSSMSRTKRIRGLNSLVDAALLKYRVNEALGIGLDADDEKTGYDLHWIRGTPVPTPDLRRIADTVFPGEPETSIANPFGEARAYTPPVRPEAK